MTARMTEPTRGRTRPGTGLPPAIRYRIFLSSFRKQQMGQMAPKGVKPKDAPAQEVYSLGSGFIIDPAGYVVTNNHVINNAEEIHVILSDDTKLDAKVVGRDSKTDLALLKVEAKHSLPYVTFGDSDKVRVGDWVVAIGNPYGLGGTVTAGIISARSRSINAGPFDDFLQTDAAINRGNSGGPMFDIRGNVIGINTAIFSPSGGSIGIGFAVPSTMAKTVIDQLRQYGRTYRGWLGVQIQDVSDEIAESVGLPNTHGALVLDVTPGSPASKTDIKSGDVILEFNGQPIKEMRELPRRVAEIKAGKAVPVKLWRDGKARMVQVTLGELDENGDETPKPKELSKAHKNGDLPTQSMRGLKLVTLNDTVRARFHLPKSLQGVLIVEVEEDSAAGKQGLRGGDIIRKVNGAAVQKAEEVGKALAQAASAKRDNALVLVQRGEVSLYVTLPTKP